MIVAAPAATAVNDPAALTEATVVVLLLQVPPPVASDNGADAPTHSTDGPVIGDGEGLTVTVV